MRTCLVLGGAACLWDDVDAYAGPVGAVVACNDAGYAWPGALAAWVSLHPLNWTRPKDAWLAKRDAKGYPPAPLYTHDANKAPDGAVLTPHQFPGCEHSGSSGMFAAKVALIDLCFDQVVLCGIPMAPMKHFTGLDHWQTAHNRVSPLPNRYLKRWRDVPAEFTGRIRSMSGATRDLFGAP
ncbi:hypothetical protein GCM10007928_02180 [Sulfitobacter porphyrae]|nr:hypothetical protein GCM10007928_02180 [Sulfitobacter porphyrae]